MPTRHMWELLAEEAALDEFLYDAMRQVAIPFMQNNPTLEPTLVVPRLGSVVATYAHATSTVKLDKERYTSFLDEAVAKTIAIRDRPPADEARIMLLHLANILSCCGATSGALYMVLRSEIDRPLTKPFRPSDRLTPALAAIALRAPNRAAVIARIERLAGTYAHHGNDTLEAFIDLASAGTKGDDLHQAYEAVIMDYVVDLGTDYPAPDRLTELDGVRFFDPNTMLWLARIRWNVCDQAPLATVAERLRDDLRDYVGLK